MTQVQSKNCFFMNKDSGKKICTSCVKTKIEFYKFICFHCKHVNTKKCTTCQKHRVVNLYGRMKNQKEYKTCFVCRIAINNKIPISQSEINYYTQYSNYTPFSKSFDYNINYLSSEKGILFNDIELDLTCKETDVFEDSDASKLSSDDNNSQSSMETESDDNNSQSSMETESDNSFVFDQMSNEMYISDSDIQLTNDIIPELFQF